MVLSQSQPTLSLTTGMSDQGFCCWVASAPGAFADHLSVDMLDSRYKPVNFGAGESLVNRGDRLRLGWLFIHHIREGGVPQEQKMLKGHLPSVKYHQVYQYTKMSFHEKFDARQTREMGGVGGQVAGQ